MRDGFTFMELLVSVFLIVTVIAAMITITSNNLDFLTKKTDKALNAQAAVIALVAAKGIDKEKKIYMDELIVFDDDIDRKLKEIKFEIEIENLKEKTLYDDTPYPLVYDQKEYKVFTPSIEKTLSMMELKL